MHGQDLMKSIFAVSGKGTDDIEDPQQRPSSKIGCEGWDGGGHPNGTVKEFASLTSHVNRQTHVQSRALVLLNQSLKQCSRKDATCSTSKLSHLPL